MSELILATRNYASRVDAVWIFLAVAFASLFAVDSAQGIASLDFTIKALLGVGIFLALSIGIAAYAKASGADRLIAQAFTGNMGRMVFAAALMGALSPFCSCGVIPLIAALLAMGVPLAPVMAFWLASPLMDPSMFLLTAGTLGSTFAIYKTVAAFGVGMLGGLLTWALLRAGYFAEPLREGIGNGGCGGAVVRNPGPVQWHFWGDEDRCAKFRDSAVSNMLFLGKWLTVAFFLESLMLTYVPAELISEAIGGEGWSTILGATLVGVPAYLNGYAALPLVSGLIEQGMAPGAGMAFMLAGGVSSVPAAIAVWALARPPVFAAYLGFAFVGAFSFGLGFALIN